jgi:hypothetical protein
LAEEFFMGGLFGGGSSPEIVEPAAPPTRSDAEVRAEALAERKRRAAAVGRAATIKTSPSGVTEDAPVATKVLMGQ